MTGEFTEELAEACCDQALASGKVVIHDGVAFVPDVVMAELQANGIIEVDGEIKTQYARRPDGRTVYFFRWPGEKAKGA